LGAIVEVSFFPENGKMRSQFRNLFIGQHVTRYNAFGSGAES
jgi:hypothetical protein